MERDLMTPTNDERLTAIIDTLRAIQPTPLAETRVLCAGRVDEDAAWLREHGYTIQEIDADGVRAQLITPPGALDQGTLVAFHGGGFIVGRRPRPLRGVAGHVPHLAPLRGSTLRRRRGHRGRRRVGPSSAHIG